MNQKSQAEAPKLQLVYWNIRGMAQPIRHLLEFLGLSYQQTLLPIDNPNSWYKGNYQQIRKKCLFPNLPYLDDNGFVISETIAISKYLCRKAGRLDLLGATIEDKAKVDQLLAKYIIHRTKLGELFRKDFLQGVSEQVVKQKLNTLLSDIMQDQYIPTVFKLLQTSDYQTGYLTIADFFAYESVFYLTGVFSEKMAQYPHIFSFKQRFESLPEIKKYNQSNRVTLKTFLNPMKNWEGDSKYN